MKITILVRQNKIVYHCLKNKGSAKQDKPVEMARRN